PARAAGERYALLDLDYLSRAGTGTGGRAGEFAVMLQNLAAVAANYRRAGIRLFVFASLSAALVRWPARACGICSADPPHGSSGPYGPGNLGHLVDHLEPVSKLVGGGIGAGLGR